MSSMVLVIENDEQHRRDLRVIFHFIQYDNVIVSECDNWREAVEEPERVQAVFLGECGGRASMETIVNDIRGWDEDVPVIVLAPSDAPADFGKDLGAGVMGKITMPPAYDDLIALLQKAQIYRGSRRQDGKDRPVTLFRSLVGNSRAIRHVRKLVEQVAASTANVLILGESGTGKEVVARNLHYNSPRRDKPFVPINCGAIPADLLESELFGHEKGAFTGAITARQGRFEMAEGGTLFLDEIGDMSMPMQVKLLRVLQERTFERVGSNKSIKTNVRIVAATHHDLEQRIEEGKFREDLFYRLNVFPIEMPPLRERASDVPLLINELISRFEHEGRSSVRLTPAAIISLCQYQWPGNVRELANLMERLVILHPYGVVDLGDLPEKFRIQGVSANLTVPVEVESAGYGGYSQSPQLPPDDFDLKECMSTLECSYIRQALEEAHGVVAHAAKRLNMRRTTLVEKMRKYGLQRADEATNF